MSITNLLTSASFWTSVTIISVLLYQWWKKPHPNFPPLIRGFPGLGVLPYLGNDPSKIFKKWSQELKKPVISVRIGRKDTVIIHSYKIAYEALFKQSASFAGKPTFYVFDQLVQNSGFAMRDFDETYKTLRSFAVRYLRKGFGNEKSSAAMESVVNDEANHLINELKKCLGKSIDLKLFTFCFALNVISRAVTEKHFEYNDPKMKLLSESVGYLFSENKEVLKLARLNFLPSLRYFSSYQKLIQNAKVHYKYLSEGFIDPVIEEHRRSFNPNHIRDIIDQFLYEQQYGSGKSDKIFNHVLKEIKMEKKQADMIHPALKSYSFEQYPIIDKICMTKIRERFQDEVVVQTRMDFKDKNLRQIALDLLAAGTSTVAASISWLVLCYLSFPCYQNQLHTEIQTVLGANGIPTLDLQDDMPFTFAYVLEVMRYRSISPLMYRKTKETVNIAGYTIPRETPVLINFFEIRSDGKTWKNPDKFDPYRHIDQNGKFVRSSKVLPFGLGYRSCPGEQLAKREVFIVFVKLLQCFHISANLKTLPSLDNSYYFISQSPLPYKVTLTKRT